MVSLAVRLVATGLYSVQVRFTNAIVRHTSKRGLNDCFSAVDIEWLAFLIRTWRVPGSKLRGTLSRTKIHRPEIL